MLHLGAAPRLVVAGRTDAGVHARGQVAHLDLEAALVPPAVLDRVPARLLGVLPADVRVRSVLPAAPGFDARFSALARRYIYRVCDDPLGADPLRRWDTLLHPRPLDLDRLAAGSVPLLGEHDFAPFCRRREGATTVRRLQRLDWSRDTDGSALATVEADAFCHSMVRSLVGALLPVGDGRRPPEWPRGVLSAGVRDPRVPVAPAHGLTLVAVRYPPAAELGSRADTTRRLRG